MSYYKNFSLIIGNPLYSKYLGWAYKKGINDLAQLNTFPNFITQNFRCLLCGVGNEKTANEFIKFVIARNPNPEIFIIDIGDEQITAVKNLVSERYPKFNIKVKNINALNLEEFIGHADLDWIETDGFLPFFDSPSLDKLLKVWRNLLKPNGFITLRDVATPGNWQDIFFDKIIVWIAKYWLGVSIFKHTRLELISLFKLNGFKFIEGSIWIPMMKRYSLIKDIDFQGRHLIPFNQKTSRGSYKKTN